MDPEHQGDVGASPILLRNVIASECGRDDATVEVNIYCYSRYESIVS